jgi:hypothetical protein
MHAYQARLQEVNTMKIVVGIKSKEVFVPFFYLQFKE